MRSPARIWATNLVKIHFWKGDAAEVGVGVLAAEISELMDFEDDATALPRQLFVVKDVQLGHLKDGGARYVVQSADELVWDAATGRRISWWLSCHFGVGGG